MRCYSMGVLCASCLRRLQFCCRDVKLSASWIQVLSSQSPLYIQSPQRHFAVQSPLRDLNVPPSQRDLNVPPSQRDLNVSPSQRDLNVPPSQRDRNVPPSQRDLNVPPSQRYLGVPPSQRHGVLITQTHLGVQTSQRYSYTQSANTQSLHIDDDSPKGDETLSTMRKMKRNQEKWYITDTDLADKIAKLISAEICRSSIVIETDPGPGILTEALIKHNVNNLILTESNETFMPSVQNLVVQKGSGIIQQIESFNFFQAMTIRHGNQLVDLMQTIPQKEWTEDPALSIIGFVASRKKSFSRGILHHILGNVVTRQGLWALGRVELFIFLAANNHLICRPLSFPQTVHTGLYTRFSVLYHLLFDIKTLAQVKNTDFSPPFPKRTKKMRYVDDAEINSLYLVHIRPKANIFEMFKRPDDLALFVIFLRQIFRGKNDRIITKMERLVPDCGIHMINQGFTMMQKMGDVSPEMYVKLFKDMLTWPEYAESGFHTELSETNADMFEDDGTAMETDIIAEEEEEKANDQHTSKGTNSVPNVT